MLQKCITGWMIGHKISYFWFLLIEIEVSFLWIHFETLVYMCPPLVHPCIYKFCINLWPLISVSFCKLVILSSSCTVTQVHNPLPLVSCSLKFLSTNYQADKQDQGKAFSSSTDILIKLINCDSFYSNIKFDLFL